MSKWWDETPLSAEDEVSKKVEKLFAGMPEGVAITCDEFIRTIATNDISPSIWAQVSSEQARDSFADITQGRGDMTKHEFDRYVMCRALRLVCTTYAIYAGNRKAAMESKQERN